MLHRFGAAVSSRASRLKTMAVGLAVAASIMGPAITAAPAHAEYYWGCTYTYPNSCFQPGSGGVVNRLWTEDPDAAIGVNGYNKPFNGYKIPVHDGDERYVCGAVYWAGGLTVPWSCNWGISEYNLPEYYWGTALIGSSVGYTDIALYQNVNIYE